MEEVGTTNENLGCPERRQTTRYLFSAPVLIFRDGQAEPPDTYGISLELSEMGVSALVNDALQVGEIVNIQVRLCEGILDVAARVRHHTGRHYGFDFSDLTARQIELLRSSTRTMQVYQGRWLAP